MLVARYQVQALLYRPYVEPQQVTRIFSGQRLAQVRPQCLALPCKSIEGRGKPGRCSQGWQCPYRWTLPRQRRPLALPIHWHMLAWLGGRQKFTRWNDICLACQVMILECQAVRPNVRQLSTRCLKQTSACHKQIAGADACAAQYWIRWLSSQEGC